MCSFWLVDALLLVGREEDSRRLFDPLLGLRNDLGLLSEEYETDARRLVGNFPRAFSHIGLVDSAHNQGRATKPPNREPPVSGFTTFVAFLSSW